MLPLLIFDSAVGYDASLTGSSIQKNKVIFFLFAKKTAFLLVVQTNSFPWLIPVSCAEDISLCMDQILMKQSSLLRKEHFPFFFCKHSSSQFPLFSHMIILWCTPNITHSTSHYCVPQVFTEPFLWQIPAFRHSTFPVSLEPVTHCSLLRCKSLINLYTTKHFSHCNESEMESRPLAKIGYQAWRNYFLFMFPSILRLIHHLAKNPSPNTKLPLHFSTNAGWDTCASFVFSHIKETSLIWWEELGTSQLVQPYSYSLYRIRA